MYMYIYLKNITRVRCADNKKPYIAMALNTLLALASTKRVNTKFRDMNLEGETHPVPPSLKQGLNKAASYRCPSIIIILSVPRRIGIYQTNTLASKDWLLAILCRLNCVLPFLISK